MFEGGGVEGEEGGQEGENKVQGQSKPRLWFPVCSENRVFPSFRARVLLVPPLGITISIINNGCAPYNQKDPVVFGNKCFIKGLLAPFCLWLGTDEKWKSQLK